MPYCFFCESCAEYGLFCWTAVYLVPLNPRATLSAEEVQHTLKQVCGLISAEDINRSVSVFAFVDSISAMRFSSTVKKRFQKDISVDDLTQCSTIQEQARVLDSRQVRTTEAIQKRLEPPSVEGMAHCSGQMTKASQTGERAETFLERLGLPWNDVEDVIPAPETVASNLDTKGYALPDVQIMIG